MCHLLRCMRKPADRIEPLYRTIGVDPMLRPIGLTEFNTTTTVEFDNAVMTDNRLNWCMLVHHLVKINLIVGLNNKDTQKKMSYIAISTINFDSVSSKSQRG